MNKTPQVGTIIYRFLLRAQGLEHKVWARLRSVLIGLGIDLDCTLLINGQMLQLPLSHNLPLYQKLFPLYDRLPGRLSRYMRHQYGFLTCIDVGANIGDSIAAFYIDDTDTFLAVEPNHRFRDYLTANWGWSNNIIIEDVLCRTGSEETTFAIHEEGGTAVFKPVETGVSIKTKPLDHLVQEHLQFVNSNVLKIDTDGYDFEVIAGGSEFIKQCRPAILFESAVSSNTTYVEDCLRTLDLLSDSGYVHCLIYDNFGYLMGKYALSAHDIIGNLLFYQLTSPFAYYDILAMREEDLQFFYRTEVSSP